MTMEDWAKRLDRFLESDDRNLLEDGGKVTAEMAKELRRLNLKNTVLSRTGFTKAILIGCSKRQNCRKKRTGTIEPDNCWQVTIAIPFNPDMVTHVTKISGLQKRIRTYRSEYTPEPVGIPPATKQLAQPVSPALFAPHLVLAPVAGLERLGRASPLG